MLRPLPKPFLAKSSQFAAGLLIVGFVLVMAGLLRQHPAPVRQTAPANHSTHPLAAVFTRGISLKGGTSSAARAPHAAASADMDGIRKSDWFSNVKKEIEKKYYHINASAGQTGYHGANLAQGLKADFTALAFSLSPLQQAAAADWQLTLQFGGLYADGHQTDAAQGTTVVKQNENDIEYAYGDRFAIQYHNDKTGIRQNFLIRKAPAANTRQLAIHLKAQGDWVVNKVHDKELQFARRNLQGRLDRKIIYKDLKAWDANGTPLLAKMESGRDGEFSIEVHAEKAVYPVTIDPLSTSPNNTFTGAGANDFLGISVASAGDVNGDGYSDVIIGASGNDFNQTPPYTNGYAYLYLGSATGLSSTPAASLTDNIAGDKFGVSVASAGDVNGDGFADVIVGADLYAGGGTKQGVAYIYLGGDPTTGVLLSPATTLYGSSADDNYFGYSVASAGDVNGDGYSDVIIGAWGFNSSQGQSYVYLGSASGITLTGATTQTIVQPNYRFGYSVAGIGDLNGDGYGDVIVGAPGANGLAGLAQVYEGSASGVLTPIGVTYNGTVSSTDALGTSVAGAGDVNGDGYADFIIGASGVNAGQGSAYLYLGGTGTPTAGGTVVGLFGGTKFGCSVASAGDVNGDGYADVIIGAYGFLGPIGYSYVFYGSSTGIVNTDSSAFTTNSSTDLFGSSVAGAGDVNGDGYSDIIMGANATSSNAGAAYVYQGGPRGSALTATPAIAGANSASNFGFNLASAGDLNSDGYSDVVVGAYSDISGQGAAYVFLGSATGLPNSVASATVLSDPGGVASDDFGVSVAAAGDVNGDGYGDLIIGAPGTSGGKGAAYIYFGSASGLASTSPSQTIAGTIALGGLGSGVAGAGDVNGDGYKDVIVGVPTPLGLGSANFYPGGSGGIVIGSPVVLTGASSLFGAAVAGAGDVNGDGYNDILVGSPTEGKVYVYHGSSTGPATTATYSITGPSSVHFGLSLSTAGDVNGDGYGDIIVGDYGANANAGAFYVYNGSSGGLNTSPALTVNGTGGSKLGTSVAGLSDVNGDGYSDVAAGAPGTGAGSAFVYFGSPAGVSSPASITLTGITAGDKFGSGIAGAGDVNGDGFSDVVVGASAGSGGNGAASLFEGNNAAGHGGDNVLKLYETDLSTPIKADNVSLPNFGLGLFVQPPFAHAKARLVWEVEANGSPFKGSPITNSVFSSAQGVYSTIPVGGTELKTLVNKVPNNLVTKVRVRVEYAPTTFSSGQVYGPWIYTQALSTGTSTGTILPLTWLSFTATVEGGQDVLLNWKTADELNTQYFSVEHSTNAADFSEIGKVAASGTNIGVSSYDFTHTHPGAGTHYYRLKQVDVSGNFTYSKIVTAIINPGAPSLSFYPNPATDQLTVVYTNGSVAVDVLRFINVSGAVVREIQINPNNASTNVPLTGLSKGVYFIQLASGSLAPKQVVIQ